MEPKYNGESATSPGGKYQRDEAMTGTHYSNNPSDSQANTMAMTKQQFIEYQRLKQQINKNIKKNTTQNFYLSDSPDAHRTINRRVQSITDEIAKQRQYLPQFQGKEERQALPNDLRKTENKTQQVFTPDQRGQRNPALSYGKSPNGQLFGSPEPNFGGNLASNKFNENLELFQNQQSLQASLIDRAGRVKNINTYKHEVQDVFNKHQVAQTRKKMIHMMENMPSTIGIFSNQNNNRPEIPFLNDSYSKGGGRGFKSQNKRLQSSFSRHESQPKYQTMGQKGASKMSQYTKIHEFAKNYQRSIKKTRRNINNAYFDHIADEMTYNLNKTQLDVSSNEVIPPNLDYDMFEKPYGRKKSKNQSKTPVRGGKKRREDKWPLVMNDSKLGFSQDEHAAMTQFKQKAKKLKSPTKGPADGILKVPDLGTPRGHHFGQSGSAVGYVNYVNGVPVEGSPDFKRAKKVTLPKGQKLPKLKQSPQRDYYDESTAFPGSESHTASKEQRDFKAKGQKQAKNRKSAKYASNLRSKSPQKDPNYERDRERLIQQHENLVKGRPGDGKHVSISTNPLHSQSQQQINIILPKRDAKEMQQMTPDKQLATVQAGIDSIRKIASAKSGAGSQGILKNRGTQHQGQAPSTAKHAKTMSKSTGRGGQQSQRYQSIGSRGDASRERTKRSKSTRKGSYKGSGPLPQRTVEKEPPSYIVKDQTHFKKHDTRPSVLDLQINQEDYMHLMSDDMDMVSRHEVIYKILKDQLRNHQRELVKMKEDQKLGQLEKKMATPKKKMKPIDLSKFARHIKHFELYGPQRGVAPEIKRIIKNLTCQEHHFMYCPSCKQYESKDFDPVQNIQKFMDYVKKEQEKLKKYNRSQSKKSSTGHRGVIKAQSPEGQCEDSVSEITDLDEQEILHKYLQANMTEKDRKRREREHTQKRLYGHEDYQHKHICSTTHQHRPKSQRIPKGPTVKVQLKEASDGVSMQDEENSAHQFSLHNKSMQADSEERLEAEMQTSAIIYKSKIDQTSKQDAQSMNIQTSEIEYISNNMQTNLYPEGYNRCEMACQTDPKLTKPKTPVKRNQKLQTEKPRAACDMYKEDWVHSVIFKKAVKNEAIKRGLPFEEIEDDDEEDFAAITEMQSSMNGRTNSDYYNTQPGRNRLASMIQTGGDNKSDENASQANAQDPDTDNTQEKDAMHQSAIGFMKRFQEKGDIQMLTESEIRYIKKLLKEKNLGFWSEKSTLHDLHRHTKYTIRKVSSHMANIDNYQIFKRLKDPTREHTLYLVYRAERLFSAESEAEKIFKLVANTLFDAEQFQKIMDDRSIKREDQIFVDKRSVLFNRIMSLMNNFLEVYRLFNNKMTFKGQPLRDYIVSELERISECVELIEAEKRANPEAAAIEDARDMGKVRKNRAGLFSKSFANTPGKSGKKNALEEETPAKINNRYEQEDTPSKDLETPAALKASQEPESPAQVNDDLNDRGEGEDIDAIKVRDNADMSNEGGQRDKKGQVVVNQELQDQLNEKEKKRKPGPTVPVHIMEEDPYAEREKRREAVSPVLKQEDQDNIVGLQTIQAINQQVDEELGEDKVLEKNPRGKSMAGLHGARGSSPEAQIQIDVENPAQTIGQSDDFAIKTQTVWNPKQLNVNQDASNGPPFTQGQVQSIQDVSMSNSKTVGMNPDKVINAGNFKSPLSEGTHETKELGLESQAVKNGDQIRPGTGDTQHQMTPRLPGFDEKQKIDEQQVEETEGNDRTDGIKHTDGEEKEQREVTQGGEDDQ